MKLAVFTGAGVSRESGIPTFEEMDVRDRLTRTHCIHHPEDFYQLMLQMYDTAKHAQPNAAHLAIAAYGLPVVTMNIDCLHTRAGSRQVVEVHGALDYVYCAQCRQKRFLDVLREGVHCPNCGRVYSHNVVLYGDMIPRLQEAYRVVENLDELLVVGTSMVTSTASYVMDYAQLHGAKITMINDHAATRVPQYLREKLGEPSE